MPKQRSTDYDDYDDGYDDDIYGEEEGEGHGEDEVANYVDFIREKLGKGVRISDDAIIAQLEVYDYSTKDTIKAIQAQLTSKNGNKVKPSSEGKGSAAPSTKGAPSQIQKATTKSSQAQSKTTAPLIKSAAAILSSDVSESAMSSPMDPQTVFSRTIQSGLERSVEASDVTLSSAESLALSDTETELPAVASSAHSSGKLSLTLVVVGHVDAGKSTLVGHLVHQLGHVSTRMIDKYDRESRNIGKASFAFAWVMDERQAERDHGVTIDIAERKIETSSYHFTLLDAPGHRDYIPNMIRGAAQGDAALLVVPSAPGEFESATGPGAQTREHAVLLKALGVQQVVVVVNKMDSTLPPWSASRFHQISEALRALLVGELQFRDEQVRFVPTSGLSGENLRERPASAGSEWYAGPSLMEALDSLRPPVRRSDRPFRARAVPQEDSRGLRTNSFAVSVLQGRVAAGRSVGLARCSGGRVHLFSARILALRPLEGEDTISVAIAGEKVALQLALGRGEELQLQGDEEVVLFKGPGVFPRVARRFAALLMTLVVPGQPPLICGHVLQLYVQGVEVQCRLSRIVSVVGSTSKAPKSLPGGRSGVVHLEVQGSVLLEAFAACRALGRFALRSKGFTVAVGTVEDVL